MNEPFLSFGGELEVEAKEIGVPTFSMTAYTGTVANVRGFEYPIVVDLGGVRINSQKIPIRRDHKEWAGVGHSTQITISDGAIKAGGVISRDTDYSRDIVHSGKLGFPWQASIGGPVHKTQFLVDGETAIVNGRSVAGPVHIVTSMTLKEISFVEFGADPNTSATIEAIAVTGELQNLFTNKEESMTLKTNESTVEAQKVETPAVHLSATGAIDEYRKLIAEERNRISQIGLIGGGSNMAMETQAIAEGWTAQRFELELLRASRPAAPPVHSTAPQINEKALEVIALSAAGIASSQLEKRFDPQTLEMSDKFRGMGLQEFCEVACGQRLPRFQRDAHGWLEAAFSTTSLPGILSNVANKMLLDGYNYVEDAWRKVCKIASVTDFKTHKRYRMTGSFKFEPVGPQGELKHGVIGEQEYTQQADTHGIMFALTRKMIIDDDLGALTDIPRQVGMGAAEAIADAVWELLLANPQQRDGKAFFSAEHKNLLTGVDSKLSINGLTNAEVRFGEQTKPTVATDNKPKERPLGIMPSILLVPIAQKVIAEMLMKATTVNETASDGKPVPNTNPHAGKYEIVSSTYLSSSAIAGSSANAWYLMADPNRLPSLEVAFLGGVDRPTIERADADFDKLGIQFRGYIDFGVKEQDHRGMLKVTGE